MDRFARGFVQDHSFRLQKRAADMMDSFNIVSPKTIPSTRSSCRELIAILGEWCIGEM